VAVPTVRSNRNPVELAALIVRACFSCCLQRSCDRILCRFTPRDLVAAAVLAHEIGHMANRDGVLMTFVSAPAMLGSLLLRVDRAFPFFLVYLPVWLFGLVLLWSTSRAREYYADRAAALLTGAPEQLASALQELGGMKAKGDLRGGAAMHALCIVRPGRPRWYKPDLSHPPIEKRIDRLERLAERLGKLSAIAR
jgi:heat shock protein HtpX